MTPDSIMQSAKSSTVSDLTMERIQYEMGMLQTMMRCNIWYHLQILYQIKGIISVTVAIWMETIDPTWTNVSTVGRFIGGIITVMIVAQKLMATEMKLEKKTG